MKKLILACAIAATLVGCKTLPSEDTARATSKAIGTAAALVLNQTSLSAKARTTIVEVSKHIDETVIASNMSFEAAWTIAATKYIDMMIEKGELAPEFKDIIVCAVKSIGRTVDYCVDKRWPKLKEYDSLIEAVTHGFFDGFLTYFDAGLPFNASDYDDEAYKFMTSVNKW